MEAVILAAGLGSRLKEHTRDTAKCLLKFGETTIFERMVHMLLEMGIQRIHVVVGHAAEKVVQTIKDPRVHYIFNPDYQTSNSIVSLSLALPSIRDSFFSLPCDLIFDQTVLESFFKRHEGIVLAVDRHLSPQADGTMVTLDGSRIVRVSKGIPIHERDGETNGMQAFYGAAVDGFQQTIFELLQKGYNHWLNSDVLNWMILNRQTQVFMADITGLKWCEVDTENDLIYARSLFGK